MGQGERRSAVRLELAAEIGSAHLRHDQVQNDQVDLIGAEQGQGFRGSPSLQDLAFAGLQNTSQEAAVQIELVNDEDGGVNRGIVGQIVET